ncbi:MAG: protein kinase [Deltaproteobacteria bacterium]|nr:protein kinase [Deltaproteobacteria bacterium]
MELQEGSVFGPYRIVARIGRGGMAEVYLAQRTGPGGFARDLVIKRILPHLAEDQEFVRMFVNEAAILARLTHSNVAQVYDFGRIDDSYYLAMEYVRGTSLDRLLAVFAGEGLPIPIAVRITADTARGLAYAHRATDALGRPLGIVHSDISPSNVLISFEGEVKLIDFGIARAGSQHSEQGALKGKIRYMSPEQCRGWKLDPRTDIYSLGIVLWEALTGRNLYDQDQPIEVLGAVLEHATPRPSSLRPSVPEALDLIAMRALEKDPAARFQRAEELAQAIDLFVAEQRMLANEQVLGELVSTRFASTLVISIRDEAPVPSSQRPARTVRAVPGATTGGSARAADTGRDDATVAEVPSIQAPRSASAFEIAPTMAETPGTPPPSATPLPPRVTTSPSAVAPSTSVLVAEPLRKPSTGDSSDPRPVASVPVTAARVDVRAPAPEGLSASWQSWNRGTRWILAAAVLAVVVAFVLLAWLGMRDRHSTSPGTHVAAGPTAVAPPPVLAGTPGADASDGLPDHGEAALADAGGAKAADASSEGAGAKVSDEGTPPQADAGPAPDADSGPADAAETGTTDVPRDAARREASGPSEAAPTFGKVTIDSRPWSIVLWRGRQLGETPVIDAELPVGNQPLVLVDGAGRRYRRTVRVLANQSVRIRFDLVEP